MFQGCGTALVTPFRHVTAAQIGDPTFETKVTVTK